MCVLSIYYGQVYINAHTYSIYFENIYVYLHVYVYINIIYIINKYISYINITYFSEIYTCMCVYLYIHNTYTQHTYIYYVNKNFYFWMRLIVKTTLIITLPPVKKSSHIKIRYISFWTVFTCKWCLICDYFSPDSDEISFFHCRKQYYG